MGSVTIQATAAAPSVGTRLKRIEAPTVAQLHVEAQRLYAQLCVLEPADYTASGWPAEFASLAELDAWPDSPTVKHYTEVIAGLRIVLADVSASRDAEDPEQSSEVIIDAALADDDIPF